VVVSNKQHRSSRCEAAYSQMHSLKCICRLLWGCRAEYAFGSAMHLEIGDNTSRVASVANTD
jgi:hypothetical protein